MWHVVLTGPRSPDQRREALDFVAVSLGHHPGTLAVVHHCPQCGSEEHGAPSLVPSARALRDRARHPRAGGPPGPDLPAVSFSRAGGWLATAWIDAAAAGRGWRIGIDMEVAVAPAFTAAEGLAAVGLSPDEAAAVSRLAPVDRPEARAMLWSLKESVVKARGTGFEQDPAAVSVTAPGTLDPRIPGHPEAVLVPGGQWPAGPPGQGLTGMLCLLRDQTPEGE